jgi:two-component system chemotaxis response regulator CheB
MSGSRHRECNPIGPHQRTARRALECHQHARAKLDERRAFDEDPSRYETTRELPRGSRPATVLLTVAGSAGALEPMLGLVASLPSSCTAAVAIALHGSETSQLVALLERRSVLHVRWAASASVLTAGCVYVVPPSRHLVVNPDRRLTLSSAPRQPWFRPSLDWMIDSAAASFRERHVAVVLSGRLNDGARGIRTAHRLGGATLAQHPRCSSYPAMPQAAINTACIREILPLVPLFEAVNRAIAAYDADDAARQEPFAS